MGLLDIIRGLSGASAGTPPFFPGTPPYAPGTGGAPSPGLLGGGGFGGLLSSLPQRLSTPQAQLGAMILANSGGQAGGIGQAIAGYGQQQREAENNKLRDEYLRAQIEAMRRPEVPKTPAVPDDIQKYEYAKSQGYKGSYLDFQTELRRAGASTVSVNTGSELPKPPPGYYRGNPNAPGLTAEPGGPAAQEIADAERKRQERQAAAAAQAGNVVGTIDNALTKIGPATTGIGGTIMRKVPGTKAVDLSGELETIKANLGFDRIQQMREQSPTGGALGAVAVQELNALQSTVASLDQNQSEDQLRQSLKKIRQHYMKWQQVMQSAQNGSTNAAGMTVFPNNGGTARKVTRTGTVNGRKVVQYSDGSIEYAQ